MALNPFFIRTCICLCGNIAELKRDKKQKRPYLTCKGCSTKIFWQGDTNPGYLGYLVLEKKMRENLAFHAGTVRRTYIDILENLEESSRIPKPRKKTRRGKKAAN